MSLESLIFLAFIILVLILLNGFFSTSEIAIISSKRSVIDKLAQDGNESAELVRGIKAEPERFLATVQVGVTVLSTLASVIGGVIAAGYLEPLFASIPYEPVQNASELLAVVAVVIIISYAMLILGELAPKSLAIRYSERIACFSAKPIKLFSRIAGVVVGILTASTTLTLRLMGIRGAHKEVFASEEDIRYIISEGREKGVLEETEAALLHGVFEFADTTAMDILLPKPKIKAIEINTPPDEVLKFIATNAFSRYPVYRDNLNNIVGILYNKDVFKAMEQGAEINVLALIREAYFIPNSVMISRLLREMQRRKMHIAIVVDEHGDFDGIVTIEDILEEIVGEIEDEYDVEKGGLVEKLKDGTYIVDASTSLRDLNDIGIPFNEEESDEFVNLAGFMLAKLQRIPRGGEFVLYNSKRYTVVDMEGKRIAKVKIEELGNERKKSSKGPHLKKVSG